MTTRSRSGTSSKCLIILKKAPYLFPHDYIHTYIHTYIHNLFGNYRLTHSASELSGFTCTRSLTMNEKIQYRTRRPRAVLKISSSLLVNECR